MKMPAAESEIVIPNVSVDQLIALDQAGIPNEMREPNEGLLQSTWRHCSVAIPVGSLGAARRVLTVNPPDA